MSENLLHRVLCSLFKWNTRRKNAVFSSSAPTHPSCAHQPYLPAHFSRWPQVPLPEGLSAPSTPTGQARWQQTVSALTNVKISRFLSCFLEDNFGWWIFIFDFQHLNNVFLLSSVKSTVIPILAHNVSLFLVWLLSRCFFSFNFGG